jgi:phi13 family phage major tail protein
MATVGFDGIEVGIHDGDTERVKEVIDVAKVSGAINAAISGLGAAMKVTYANNVPFHAGAVGTGAPEVTLQVVDLTSEQVNKILGVLVEDGIEKVGATTQPPYISLLLRSQAPNGATIYVALLKGKMAYPEMELATAEGETPDVNTDEISGQFIARRSDQWVFFKARTDAEGFDLAKFKELVFPGYTSLPGAGEETATEPSA